MEPGDSGATAKVARWGTLWGWNAVTPVTDRREGGCGGVSDEVVREAVVE